MIRPLNVYSQGDLRREATRGGKSDRFSRRLRKLVWVLMFLGQTANSAAAVEERLTLRFVVAQAADQIPDLTTDTEPSTAQEYLVDSSEGGWWLLTLPPATEESTGGRVLYFQQAHTARIGLLLPTQEELVWRQRIKAPGPAWGVHMDLPVLLPPELDGGGRMLLHFSDVSNRRIVPKLAGLDSYLQNSARLKAIFVACASALLIMALLSFGFQRGFDDRSYGYLAFFAAASAAYVISMSGELYLLLPGGYSFISVGTAFERSSAGLSLIFSLLFINRFLQLEQRRPRAQRLLLVLVWAQLLVVVSNWIQPQSPHPAAALAGNVLVLLAIPVVFIEALKALRDGIKSGLFVLLAWTPSLLTLCLWIAILQGWLHSQVDLLPLVSIGMVLQVAVLSLGLAEAGYRLRRERDLAESKANLDPLTGLLNRRALDRRLQELSAAADQTGEPLTLLFLDLDHFKQINDSHGHAIGDDCLRHLGRLISSMVRANDPVARYGGEEFLVVLPGLDTTGARALAESIRQRIETTPLVTDNATVHLKASLGLSRWRPGKDTVATMTARADQALYMAKREGRNRVVVATEPGAEDSVAVLP
ncbi:MAG: diguanylate cyclase [Wenzhouxiangella sp.]|nr:diguanylate cyclase [Wenzhouxiangella sp.]MCH8478456.1 GGDEF domain-containing protein [Wenzhouxiangella sp.]